MKPVNHRYRPAGTWALSHRQTQLLLLLAEGIEAGRVPSRRELAARLGVYFNAISGWQHRLIAKGLIQTEGTRLARAISLTPLGWDVVDGLRVLGYGAQLPR